jgi:hypothetical protein
MENCAGGGERQDGAVEPRAASTAQGIETEGHQWRDGEAKNYQGSGGHAGLTEDRKRRVENAMEEVIGRRGEEQARHGDQGEKPHLRQPAPAVIEAKQCEGKRHDADEWIDMNYRTRRDDAEGAREVPGVVVMDGVGDRVIAADGAGLGVNPTLH